MKKKRKMKLKFKKSKLLNFNGIATDMKIKIAEQMDGITQAQFELSSKHGRDIVKLTRHEPVYDADELDIIGSMGMLNIGVSLFNLQYQPHTRLVSVSKVTLGGVLELCPPEALQTVEFTNKEVEMKWWCTSTNVPFFLKLAERLNITRCMSLQECVKRDFLELPNVAEFKKVHFALNYATFNGFCLNKLKAADIVLRLKKFSHLGEDVDAAPLIASKMNSFLKQWYNKEREIEWFRITSESTHPDDTAEILLSGLPASIFRKYEGRNAELNLLKAVKYNSPVYSLGEENVVYILDRGDKKLLILVKDLSEVIVQELTEDVGVVNLPPSGDTNCRKRKLV